MENQEQELPQDLGIQGTITGRKFDQAEWCFQFDDEEPNAFAWSQSAEDPGDLNFNIGPTEGANITFRSPGGKTFTLFVREMTDAVREARDKNIALMNQAQEEEKSEE
jgi:hypothetical protein